MVGGLLSDVSTGAAPTSVVAGVIAAVALLLGALYPFYKARQQSRKEADDTDAEIDKMKDRIKRLERNLRQLREKVNDE